MTGLCGYDYLSGNIILRILRCCLSVITFRFFECLLQGDYIKMRRRLHFFLPFCRFISSESPFSLVTANWAQNPVKSPAMIPETISTGR